MLYVVDIVHNTIIHTSLFLLNGQLQLLKGICAAVAHTTRTPRTLHTRGILDLRLKYSIHKPILP